MPGSAGNSQCLSVDHHDIRGAKDLLCHFFGCIEFERRLEFLDMDSEVWEDLAKLDGKQPAAFIRYTAAIALLGEMKRIQVLRHELHVADENCTADLCSPASSNAEGKKSASEEGQKSSSVEGTRSTSVGVKNSESPKGEPVMVSTTIAKSRDNWRNSREYRENIDKVRTWRSKRPIQAADNQAKVQ
jgi:hypothetical protein